MKFEYVIDIPLNCRKNKISSCPFNRPPSYDFSKFSKVTIFTSRSGFLKKNLSLWRNMSNFSSSLNSGNLPKATHFEKETNTAVECEEQPGLMASFVLINGHRSARTGNTATQAKQTTSVSASTVVEEKSCYFRRFPKHKQPCSSDGSEPASS